MGKMGQTTTTGETDMGYSKDPMSYLEEERDLMLAALGQDIEIRCTDKKQAYNQRGRFYGLRAAVVQAHEKLQALERKDGDTRGYDTEFIRAAPALRSIGLRYGNEEKTVLIIGRGAGLSVSLQNTLTAALHNAGIATTEEKQEKDIDAMMERLKDVKPEEKESSLADLGYTTTQLQEKTEK